MVTSVVRALSSAVVGHLPCSSNSGRIFYFNMEVQLQNQGEKGLFSVCFLKQLPLSPDLFVFRTAGV